MAKVTRDVHKEGQMCRRVGAGLQSGQSPEQVLGGGDSGRGRAGASKWGWVLGARGVCWAGGCDFCSENPMFWGTG